MIRKFVSPQENDTYQGRERPSERIFRRSRAAESRRRVSQNKDTKFMRFVFGLMSVGTLIVFVIIYLMSSSMKAHASVPTADGASEGTLTRPLIAGYSALDLMGLAFVIVAGYAVWRKYNRKD